MSDPSLLYLIAIVIVIGVFVLTLISTDAAISLLIYAMILSPEFALARLPGRSVVVRVDDLLLAVVFFTWLAKLAINKRLGLLRDTPLNWPMAMVVVSWIISTSLGVFSGTISNLRSGFFYILKYLEYFVLYFMVVNVTRERKQVQRFLFVMFMTAFMAGLYGYWQLARYGLGFRISTPFEGAHAEPNTFAGYLVLIMSVMAGILIYAPSGKRKVILFCLLCFLSIPFLFTYSRGGYLAFVVAYLVLTAISTRYKPMLLGLFITGIILAPFVLHHSVFDRITSTFDASDGVAIGGIKLARSPAARFTVWRDVWDMFLQRPLFGYGVTGVGFFDSQYALELGELGLVGLAVHFWIRWRIWVIALRTFHETSDHLVKGLSLGFMAGFLGLLAHSWSANIFIIVRIMEPFWFLAAMLTVVYQLNSDRSSQEDVESLASGKTDLGIT